MLIDVITRRLIWEAYQRLRCPFYLYDEQVLEKQWHLLNETAPEGTIVHYAAMANDQPSTLGWFNQRGCRVFVGSWNHLKLVEDIGFAAERIVSGITNLNRSQIGELLERVDTILLSTETELDMSSTLAGSARLLIRVNIAEPQKRLRGGVRIMGLDPDFVTENWVTWTTRDPRLVGIHSYAGTNVRNLRLLASRARKAVRFSLTLPKLKVVDIGGGFPAPSKKKISEKDLEGFWRVVKSDLACGTQLWVEPGRFLLAPTSFFVAAVTSIEFRSDVAIVGTDASVLMFPRRLLFGAPDQDHPLCVLEATPNVAQNWKKTLVTGNTTFSRDVLYNGPMQQVRPGDLLVFGNAGAYCRAAIPRFLGTIVPAEVPVVRRTYEADQPRESLKLKSDRITTRLSTCAASAVFQSK